MIDGRRSAAKVARSVWEKSEVNTRGQGPECNSISTPGSLIYVDWDEDGVADHVGIVESCDRSDVYSIKGNANNAHKQPSYAAGERRIPISFLLSADCLADKALDLVEGNLVQIIV